MKVKCLASGSDGNCYVVSDGKTSLMLECGITYKELHKKTKGDIPKSILITHEHADHVNIVTLRKLIEYGRTAYMTRGTAEMLGIEEMVEIVDRCYAPEEWKKVAFVIDSFVVLAFETVHEVAEPCGFVMSSIETKERVFFMTDTNYARNQFGGITHLMIECNYSVESIDEGANDEHIFHSLKNHLSLEDLKEFLRANEKNFQNLEKVYLCHLSEHNLNWEIAKKEVTETVGVPVVICDRDGGFI